MGFCLLYMKPYDPKVSILLFQFHTCKRCWIFLKQNFALKLPLWGTELSALRMPTFYYVLPHGKLYYILPHESFILFHHIDSSIMFHHMESYIMFHQMESSIIFHQMESSIMFHHMESSNLSLHYVLPHGKFQARPQIVWNCLFAVWSFCSLGRKTSFCFWLMKCLFAKTMILWRRKSLQFWIHYSYWKTKSGCIVYVLLVIPVNRLTWESFHQKGCNRYWFHQS